MEIGIDSFAAAYSYAALAIEPSNRLRDLVEEADFFPGYKVAFDSVGEERGWGPVSRAGFDAQNGPHGALLVGEPEEIADKILRHSEVLGGVSRYTFQMNVASLPHHKLMKAIELLGTKVAPLVKNATAQPLVERYPNRTGRESFDRGM